jgi:DNA polymerase III epsilon subunit-like protein
MTTTQHDTATLYGMVTTLLRSEESMARPIDLSTWQEQRARRAVLAGHVQQLEQAVAEVRRRLDALPALAHPAYVYWAQAVLAMPNLTILEVDTDGLFADADIPRIALVDQTGAVLFDQLCQPRRPLSAKIARLTGLTQEQIAQAPRLPEVWPQVQAAVAGRYVLSYNLEFDSGKLSESAARYDLPQIPLIGECLMLRAQEYYGTGSYPKLADLCERLGYPLPEPPDQDALDRARGQVCLLRAMSQGVTHAPAAHQVPGEAEPGEAGDPFLPDFPDE